MEKVKWARIMEEALPPTRKNLTDAGIDFYACGNYYIPKHSDCLVYTGVTVEVPAGRMLLLKPKGSNEHLVGSGVVDTYYEPGEIVVRVVNYTRRDKIIWHGEPVAQGIFVKIDTPEPIETDIEDISNFSARSGKGGILNASNNNTRQEG